MKIIDLHCDTISRIYQQRKLQNDANLRNNSFQVDLEKMRHANYLLQNFAIFIDLGETDAPYQTFQEQFAIFQEELQKNTDLISPVTSYSEITANERQGKMSALLTLEEGEACCGSLEKLREIYDLGVRMMTFTWNFPNSLGVPAEPAPFLQLKYHSGASKRSAESLYVCPQKKGLTFQGREFLREMERLGIIADVSHLSDQGIREVCEIAAKPFCASHSNARSLCRRGRNLPDELIRRIAGLGGIIGINYYGPFLSDTPDKRQIYFSRVKDIASHIRHIAGLGGISCIGLGSDFDGIDSNLELSDCSHMELLEHELKKCGFHEREVEQIFYRNALNFYRELL
ncbi:MAG: membrane dipeptidase [Lachnospiraceae bacterium]|nr:membrane dipeptidase [Lachnospiraceae bacterium]